MSKLIIKGLNGFNLTNVYRSFGKGKFKRGEYYDTNGKLITRNRVLLGSVWKELNQRHGKAYADNVASNIKAGNIYQNGRWRANVVNTGAKVASEADAIKYAKQHKDLYRLNNNRWQYKLNGSWNYFNSIPAKTIHQKTSANNSKIKTSNRSQVMDRGTVYSLYYSINDPSNLVNSGDYTITNNTNKDPRFTKVIVDTSKTPIAYMDTKGDWYTPQGNNNNFTYKTNDNWIGKHTALYDKSRALSSDGQFKDFYYTHSGNLAEYHPLSSLPSSTDILADNNGMLYLNNKLYGFLVKNGDTTGYYSYKYKNGGILKLIRKAKN